MSSNVLVSREEEGVTVVSFPERSMLDIATVDLVSAELLQIVDQSTTVRLVLDFANVVFLSSLGLSMLLRVRRATDQHGGEVLLAHVRSEMARLFRITRLDKLFLTFETVEEAVAHFRK